MLLWGTGGSEDHRKTPEDGNGTEDSDNDDENESNDGENKSQDREDENKDEASKGKKSEEDVNGDNDSLKGAAGGAKAVLTWKKSIKIKAGIAPLLEMIHARKHLPFLIVCPSNALGV